MATTTARAGLDWPLMKNNIAREDLDAVCELLQQEDTILTQSKNVRAFEEEWSRWLGTSFSVFVNSGSSANQLTIAALRELHGAGGEVIVPTLTWVSDIAAVMQNGFEPVFVDLDPRTLGMDNDEVLSKITPRTRAVFLTHVLGYNGLSRKLLDELKRRREQIRGRRVVLTAQRDQEQRLHRERQTAKEVWADLTAFCQRVRSRSSALESMLSR